MNNPIKKDVHFWTAAVIIVVFVALATACTTASITTPDGTVVTYRDFHPTGNEMQVDAKWSGVGSLKTTRVGEGAEGFVEAIDSAINSVVNPLNTEPF